MAFPIYTKEIPYNNFQKKKQILQTKFHSTQ